MLESDPGLVSSPTELFLLRESDSERFGQDDPESRDGLEEEVRRGVRCRLCRTFLAGRGDSFEMDGACRHTFFNPSGIVYEIDCYSRAEGCVVRGTPSAEFSWFSGYRWQYGLCGHCMTHLGWFFTKGDHSFYGLITSRIIND
ncbi:MAG: cereblon family protein [Thermodesulfobacteriota bacterium]